MDKPEYSYKATRELEAFVRNPDDTSYPRQRVEHLIFEAGANPHVTGIGAYALLNFDRWSPIGTLLKAGVNPRWIMSDLKKIDAKNTIPVEQWTKCAERLFNETLRYTADQQQLIQLKTVYGSPAEMVAALSPNFQRGHRIRSERSAAIEAYEAAVTTGAIETESERGTLPKPTYDHAATKELEEHLSQPFAAQKLNEIVRHLVERRGANPHADYLVAKHLANTDSPELRMLLDYGVSADSVLADLHSMRDRKAILGAQLNKAVDHVFAATLNYVESKQQDIESRTLYGMPAEIRRMQRGGGTLDVAPMLELRFAANASYNAWKAAAGQVAPAASPASELRPAFVRDDVVKPAGRDL